MQLLKNPYFRLFTFTCLALNLVGCNATLQKNAAVVEENVEPKHRAQNHMPYLAAIDLVNVLVQVPRLHPGSQQSIQMIQPQSVFGRNLYEVMQVAGYAIDLVNRRDPQVYFLSHTKKSGPDHTTYEIALDTFRVKRGYHIVDNKVAPKYSPYVYGADPSKIETDESIFRRFEDG